MLGMGMIDSSADNALVLDGSRVAFAARFQPFYGIGDGCNGIGKRCLFFGDAYAFPHPCKILEGHFHFLPPYSRGSIAPCFSAYFLPSRQKISYTTEMTRRISSSLTR